LNPSEKRLARGRKCWALVIVGHAAMSDHGVVVMIDGTLFSPGKRR
jgi:hypothetical protein